MQVVINKLVFSPKPG